MVARVVDAALASQARPVVVVTGHEPERIQATLDGRDIVAVHNPDFDQGLSTSLRVGLEAVAAEIDAVVVLLGDMPRVTARHIDRLVAAFDPLEGRAICVPTHDGKRGNPVLFSTEFLAEMQGVAGDVGARHLIGQHEDLVAEVAMEDDAIFLDIDTPAALTAIRGDAA
jgi:molybdenum cofactor cytidylyltransferase